MNFFKGFYDTPQPVNKMVIIDEDLGFLPKLIDNYNTQTNTKKNTFLVHKGSINAPSTSVNFGKSHSDVVNGD